MLSASSDFRSRRSTHGFLSDLLEDLGAAVLRDVVRDLEVTEGSGALGVHHALRNSLAVKVRHLVEEVDILQQDRTALSDSLRCGFHADWRSTGGGSDAWSALRNMKRFRYAIFNAIICYR